MASTPGEMIHGVLLHSRDRKRLNEAIQAAVAPLNPKFMERLQISAMGNPNTTQPKRVRAFSPALVWGEYARRHARTPLIVVDAGSLHCRVYEFDAHGLLVGSYENERCTGGCGRFLETMVRAIDADFAEVDALCAQSLNPYRVSSGCMVFAESEVISQVNGGSDESDIMAGVIHSVATKTASLLERASPDGHRILLVGGLSCFASYGNSVQRVFSDLTVENSSVDGRFVSVLTLLENSLKRKVNLDSFSWNELTGTPR